MWGSTYFTKLKIVHSHRKHAARIIFNEDTLTHSRPLLQSLNALNIYQKNYINMLTLCTNFKKIRRQKYLMCLLETLFINILPGFQKLTLNTKNILWLVQNIQFLLENQRSKTWNEFLTKEEKEIQSDSIFLRKIKTKLLENNNESKYFKIPYYLQVSPWTRSRS